MGTGACLEALRRTRSGEFDLGKAVTLQALQEDAAGASKRMVPLEQLLGDMPARTSPTKGAPVWLTGASSSAGTYGGPEVQAAPAGIDPADAIATPQSRVRCRCWIRLLTSGQLIAIAERRLGSGRFASLRRPDLR